MSIQANIVNLNCADRKPEKREEYSQPLKNHHVEWWKSNPIDRLQVDQAKKGKAERTKKGGTRRPPQFNVNRVNDQPRLVIAASVTVMNWRPRSPAPEPPANRKSSVSPS